MRSFHEPIIAWKAGIVDSKGICHHGIMASWPSFWKFLRVLKNEESVIRVDILQQLGGHVDPPRRARYIDCNARIVRIVDDYPNRELIPYLRAIAHNLTF